MSKSTPAESPPRGTTQVDVSFPDPYPEKEIAPVLQAYCRGTPEITIKYGTTPSQAVEILLEGGALKTSRVVFVVHGYRNTLTTEWMHTLKDAFLQQADDTVILVGWGDGADLVLIHYWQAAANTQVVGEWLSGYVSAIHKQVSHLWGIGHSLGAHVVGKAGRDSGAFKRITGLDPAGPSFEKVNHDKRFRPTDAPFVDVIHTDGYDSDWDVVDWFSPENHYGTLIPLGTVDFYPNFGKSRQPGCKWGPLVDGIACSHERAIRLFTWSVTNADSFQTELMLAKAPDYEQPVEDTVKGAMAQMGYNADQHEKTGNYYLATGAEEPWTPPSAASNDSYSWCRLF